MEDLRVKLSGGLGDDDKWRLLTQLKFSAKNDKRCDQICGMVNLIAKRES